MQRCHTLSVRFYLGQTVSIEQFNVRDSVRPRPIVDSAQALYFDVIGRDDDLSAFFEGDVVFMGEVAQQRDTSPAEPSLETSGLVIKTGMNDSRIVASLVRSGMVLLLIQSDVGTL